MPISSVRHLALTLLVLCGTAVALPARAEVEDLIRVTCIPQSSYFNIEDVQIDSEILDAPTFDASVWKKLGFYPANMRYECDLPDHKYVVTSTQAAPGPGECGEAPDIVLSVADNREPLVKNVTFGLTCTGGPSVTSILIDDNGWLRALITGGGEAPDSYYVFPAWVRSYDAPLVSQGEIENCRSEIAHHTYQCVVKPPQGAKRQ